MFNFNLNLNQFVFVVVAQQSRVTPSPFDFRRLTLDLDLDCDNILLLNIKILCFSGQILAREWSKYECGVFSEQGFKNDRLYPPEFHSGNASIANQGKGSELNYFSWINLLHFVLLQI